MPSLRVCVVGAGRAGMVHAVNLHQHVRDAAVCVLVDEDPDVLVRAADVCGSPSTFRSLEEAISGQDFDAVVLTTPTFTHHQLTVTAASAGKHVFCEKPMALTPDECQGMMNCTEQAGVVLQIGFMRRFQPEFSEAKRRVAAGDIGQPMVIKSLTRGPGLPPKWAWDIRTSNGMLAEVNSHDFDSVRWLTGSNIERVYAETANFKGSSRGVDAPDYYDNAVVNLRFKSQALGVIDGTCPADYGYDARVEILGTEGLLMIGDVRGQALLQVTEREVGAVTPVHRTWPDRFAEGYRAEMTAFVACGLGRDEPEVTGEDGYQALCAVLAANRSWKERRPVKLEEAVAE